MMHDVKKSHDIAAKIESGIRNGEEPPSCRVEILKTLLDAAKSRRYIDWLTFAYESQTSTEER
jgi:hypothetical protein